MSKIGKDILKYVKVEYDKKENVFIATSEIIKGLVLENENRKELEKEIQEIGTELIKLNQIIYK